jgi:DNA helicase-2/ATP-dependent DNA helicase PcrA
VIVERIAWLVSERGVDPRNILALTFTNKAAGEMRTRAAARLDTDSLSSWVGTFHSFGLFVLRREFDKLGRRKDFTIFDDADQLSLMKRILKELPADRVQASPREILSRISRLKQDLSVPKAEQGDEDFDRLFATCWRRYHETLEGASAVDFDDLLVLPVRLFEKHPEVLGKYQQRFRYVLVDEYQDTNRAQYLIARSLTAEHRNIFVVGDEDQAIYSWRGADIDNILNFEKDFANALVVRLEENYRSSAPILAAASAVVSNNVMRLGKTLRATQSGGERVRCYTAESGDTEAAFVADDIARRAISPSEVVVLYRTNSQARLIEEAFRRKGLAYVVVGGIQFYARKEIKDLLAYLRVIANPSDEAALRRIINEPPRGIGATTLEQLGEYASRRGLPLYQVLHEVETDQTLNVRARNAIGDFVRLMDDLALEAKKCSLTNLVESLLNRIEFRAHLQKSDDKDFRTRLEMVDEFLSACASFDARNVGGLLEFLQELSLASDVDGWDDSAPAAALMTCHTAKGLEFDHVYLIGLEEGLLPHASSLEVDGGIEEERRLCYVAMTRARKTLTLSHAQSRTLFGETAPRDPSRFLGEISRDALDFLGVGGATAARETRPRPTATPPDPGGIRVGTRVWHAKFGNGTVMLTSGSGTKLRARIRFQTGRSREFMMSAAPITILDGDSR